MSKCQLNKIPYHEKCMLKQECKWVCNRLPVCVCVCNRNPSPEDCYSFSLSPLPGCPHSVQLNKPNVCVKLLSSFPLRAPYLSPLNIMIMPIISSCKHFQASAFAFLCYGSQHCPTGCTQRLSSAVQTGK